MSHFIKERWLLTYRCTLSPEQLRRYKAKGLAPYEGSLNTDIAFEDLKRQSSPTSRKKFNRFGTMPRTLSVKPATYSKRYLDHGHLFRESTTLDIRILRDPDGIQPPPSEPQAQPAKYAEATSIPGPTEPKSPGGLVTYSRKEQYQPGPMVRRFPNDAEACFSTATGR